MKTIVIRLVMSGLMLLTGVFCFASDFAVTNNDFDRRTLEAVKHDRSAFMLPKNSTRIEEIALTPEVKAIVRRGITADMLNFSKNATGALVVLEKVINIGERIWEIVDRNAPALNVRTKYACAVPLGTESWRRLQGWKEPAAKLFRMTSKNTYGVTVLDATFMVTYVYGGNYRGRGKYLTGVSVVPVNTSVLWGFKYSMTVKVPDTTIVNVGTVRDPVAGMQVNLSYRLSSPLVVHNGRMVFYVQGDGYMKDLGTRREYATAKTSSVIRAAVVAETNNSDIDADAALRPLIMEMHNW